MKDVKYTYLLELKYLRKSDAALVAKTREEAISQVARYIKTNELDNEVNLRKYILIFAGKKLQISEEV